MTVTLALRSRIIFVMRGSSRGKWMVIPLFSSHVFMAHMAQKNFHFRSGNLAIHFPWVGKMFQNKDNLLHLPITQKTLAKDIPVCLWFDIYWYCATNFFINWPFCEPNVQIRRRKSFCFCVFRESRCIYCAQRLLICVYF